MRRTPGSASGGGTKSSFARGLVMGILSVYYFFFGPDFFIAAFLARAAAVFRPGQQAPASGRDFIKWEMRFVQRVRSRSLTGFLFIVSAALFQPDALLAEPIAVRHMEGTVHDGKTVAAGDLVQTVQGERLACDLVSASKTAR